jgi:molybdate transport system permease protein
MDWQSLSVSIRLAFVVSAGVLALGLPIALWLAFSRSRLKPFVEALTSLPFILPPTVVGFYLLLAYSKVQNFNLAFTFTGLAVGAIFFNLPIAIQPFASTLAMIERETLEAARCMGASKLKILREVVVPLCWPGLVAGVALAFAHTLGEFGVAMMIGGNLAGETRTVSVSIYDQVQSLNFASAHATALTQVAIGFVLLVSVFWLKSLQNGLASKSRARMTRAW